VEAQREAFGRWLERQMRIKDMNITGLAQLMGVSHASVSDWIRGVTGPRTSNIRKLANVLNVSVEDIYRALGRIPPETDLDPKIAETWSLLRDLDEEGLRWIRAIVRARLAEQRAEERATEGTSGKSSVAD